MRKASHTVDHAKSLQSSSAKELHRKHKESHFDVIDEAPDIIFVIDSKGNFLLANEATQKITGYSLSELLKIDLYKILSVDSHASLKKTFQTARKKAKAPLFETEIITSKGKRIPLEIHLKSIKNNNGSFIAFLGIARDITEHKKILDDLNQIQKDTKNANTKLKSIIENVPNIAIQGFNKKGEVVFWNPYSEKLFGLTEEQVKGRSLNGLLLSESEEKGFKNILKTIFRENRPAPLKEWTIPSEEKDKRYVLCSIFPIALPDQAPIAIAMSLDITARKKAEEKIREINREIEGFSVMSVDILSIKDEKELFERISQAVVDISDFNRVLISYFIDFPPYREIVGHRGVKKKDLERVKRIHMPREKYLKAFREGIKIGKQSCYIPHNKKHVLDQRAVIYGEKTYPKEEGRWHREDNLLVAMKDTKGHLTGIVSVDDSKSGSIPSEETVRPLEIFANLISEIIQRQKLAKKMKESEKKYRELVSNIKIGVFRATTGGEILEANPTAVEMFGYEDLGEFLKLKTPDLYQAPEDHDNFIMEMDLNSSAKRKEVVLRTKEGTSFWAFIIATAIRNRSEEIVYYDTVIEDITARKRLEERVKRLSITDELTGLYNRRHLNQTLPKEVKEAESWRSSLTLIMIDIDDFKQYNDTYLHLEGDEVLKQAAEVISTNIRKEEDWAARFGGDEFCIILRGRKATEALIVAERIKKKFQDITFKPKGKSVHKTLSMGIANCSFPEGKLTGHSRSKRPPINYEKIAHELTVLADKALFRAKGLGKNQIVVSQKPLIFKRNANQSNLRH
ncbi:MAG: PAS domain S-box protein [Candidatus Aminicenantes bacterium]|nr:MAG: PAS domain S-box protein [Candidatus Aminicenantes bacterium]